MRKYIMIITDMLAMIIGIIITILIFIYGGYIFVVAIQEREYSLIFVSVIVWIAGTFLAVICPLNPSSPLNAADNLQEKAIEAYEDGDKVYIDGNPVEDGFDFNGINLDKYDIKIENDTIYLMSK